MQFARADIVTQEESSPSHNTGWQHGGQGPRHSPAPRPLMAIVCYHPWVRLVFLSENLWPALPSLTGARTLLGGSSDSVATWGVVHPTEDPSSCCHTGPWFKGFQIKFFKRPYIQIWM